MTSHTLLVAGLLLAPALGAAQSARGFDPILAPRKAPTIPSSLTPREIEMLLAGVDATVSPAAEAAGMPGPDTALAMTSALGLSTEQVVTIESIRQAAITDAQRLGRAIVEFEARLDSVLAAGDPRDWSVRPIVLEIGRLQTELRYVHLRARMRIKEILTVEQQRRYAEHSAAGGHPSARMRE